MSSSPRSRLVAVALAALLGTGLIAGCSSGGSGDSEDDWCSFGSQVAQQDSEFSSINPTDPAQLKTSLAEIRDFYASAVGRAPEEIRSDVETISNAFNEFYDQLEQVDFEFMAVDESIFEIFDEDVANAGDRVEQYGFEVCGFGAFDPAPVEPGLTDEELAEIDELLDDEEFLAEIRSDLIEQFRIEGYSEIEATCLADVFDVETFLRLEIEGAFDDTVRAAIQACGVDPEALAN